MLVVAGSSGTSLHIPRIQSPWLLVYTAVIRLGMSLGVWVIHTCSIYTCTLIALF